MEDGRRRTKDFYHPISLPGAFGYGELKKSDIYIEPALQYKLHNETESKASSYTASDHIARRPGKTEYKDM